MALFIKQNGSLVQVSVGHEVSKPEQQKNVSLDLASGDQIVTPDNGQVLTQVLIKKPETLVAGNIKKDVNIAGVVGSYEAVDYLENHINANTDLYDYENNNITYLNYYAFYYDRNIRSFRSNSLISFANSHQGYVFWYCENLETIDMPNWEGSNYNSNGSNFQYCSKLVNVNLPKLIHLENQDFNYCTSLVNIDLPSVGAYMGYSVFSGCTALKTVKFGLNTNSLGSQVFANCTSLTDVYLPRTASVVTCQSTTFNGITPPVTIHVPSSLISSYQSASNWTTLYNDGKVTFVAIQ